MAEDLTTEQRLERLEAETIPTNSLSLRHRVQALEHPRPSLGDLRSLEVRLDELPPIPIDLCDRLEKLEGRRYSLGDEVSTLRRRVTEAEREAMWANGKLREHEEEISRNAGLRERVGDLTAFRGRVDQDLVELTRRIVDLERFSAGLGMTVGGASVHTGQPFPRCEDLEERIRNEAADLRGRATYFGESGVGARDVPSEILSILSRLSSAVLLGALGIMAAIRQSRPAPSLEEPS